MNLLLSGSNCVSELIISMELSLRRNLGRAFKLPVVIHLLYEEFFAIPQWMSVLQVLFFFNLSHLLNCGFNESAV